MDSDMDPPHMKKKKQSRKSSLHKELGEENSFSGLSETQESDGHENTVERKTKQRKKRNFQTENSSEIDKEEDITEKVKKKKKKRRLEEGFEDKHQKDTSGEEKYEEGAKGKKKKKRKRDDSYEEQKISNGENLADDEGIKNGAEEQAGNSGSFAKSKSKEKSSKKPKERALDSRSDADKSDYRPLKMKRKTVSFSDQVEVFGAEEMKGKDTSVDGKDDARIADASDEDNLTWGRFTKEEDQKIRDSVAKYIKEQGLDENEGLDMILNCKRYPKFRNCWDEIAGNLPWRPRHSVYNRAHVLYERSEERGWTKEEIEFVKSFQAEHGKNWSKLAKVLGKSRYHVKDTWRRIRRGEMNKGNMSQQEYQRLFDLVNYNLRLKDSQMEEKPTHRKLKKNISWEAIADKMETRDHVFCCKKWYSSLTSSMVESGEWQDGDDFILLRRLLETNAVDEEAVEWDDLLEDRSGEICRKRWKQMEKHLGEHRSKPFFEKLELLVRRYAPELIE